MDPLNLIDPKNCSTANLLSVRISFIDLPFSFSDSSFCNHVHLFWYAKPSYGDSMCLLDLHQLFPSRGISILQRQECQEGSQTTSVPWYTTRVSPRVLSSLVVYSMMLPKSPNVPAMLEEARFRGGSQTWNRRLCAPS